MGKIHKIYFVRLSLLPSLPHARNQRFTPATVTASSNRGWEGGKQRMCCCCCFGISFESARDTVFVVNILKRFIRHISCRINFSVFHIYFVFFATLHYFFFFIMLFYLCCIYMLSKLRMLIFGVSPNDTKTKNFG